MWRLTHRVFEKGQVIGYALAECNGPNTKVLPKKTIWEMACNNLIEDVKPLKDGCLIGINGLLLRNLPKYTEDKKVEVKKKKVLITRDLLASYLRKMLETGNFSIYNTPNVCYMDELKKAFIEDKCNIKNLNIFSDCISIEAEIVDSKRNKIFGYIIKNNSAIDIEYQRIIYGDYNTRINKTLKSGERVGLSLAEVVLLSSKVEISMRFQNATVTNKYIMNNLRSQLFSIKRISDVITNEYDLLKAFSIECNSRRIIDINNEAIYKHIDKSDLISYFGVTTNKSGEQSIFNMFSR